MPVKTNFPPPHVGGFLKRSVLPDELSVSDAARALGVGRPALSQLLNEHVSLSPEMAMRFEKAFGVRMDTLLRMQARYDAWQMRSRARAIMVKPFRTAAAE
jgi:addiction module HigA family antidote